VRVLHVAPSFYPALVYGGPTQSTYNLCLAEARRGCEVRVLTSNAAGPRAVLDVDTRREVPLGPLSVRYCPRVGRESVSPVLLGLLPGYVRWAEVVHLMAVYSFPTPPTLAACNLLGKPVVWSPRGMLQRWDAGRKTVAKDAWDRVCHAVAPRGMTLCFTSDHESDESTRRFGGFASVVIPNGVDLPERALHTPDPGVLRFVFLGRLHPVKGIENLLDGFARFLPGRRASLVVAGEGEGAYVASLRARAAELGVGEHVSMPGAVAGEAKRALFARADVVVVPSFRERFGIVVAEALAHEVPVIAARGTPWKRLEDEGAGLWVDNDPVSLAAAMARIAGMPLAEMGRRGRAWVARELSWDLAAERTIALYTRVAAARRGETG
jgi:glycosyltransferase involved in cell wall biosynthesis